MSEAVSSSASVGTTDGAGNTEVRVKIPASVLSKLKGELNLNTNNKVLEEALTILVWAVEERTKGRVILSSDSQGRSMTRLAMRSLR